jgi:hypothetical protein
MQHPGSMAAESAAAAPGLARCRRIAPNHAAAQARRL